MPDNTQALGGANTSLLSKVGLLFAIDMFCGAYGAYMGRNITSNWAVLGLFVVAVLLLIGVKALEGVSNVAASALASVFAYTAGVMVAPAITMHVRHGGWQ